MNKIEAREVISFGRNVLKVFIDNTSFDEFLCKTTSNLLYKNLWCAWLLNQTDNISQYIWKLLDEKRTCNLPVLLCPDDMDFWCTVVVAKTRFFGENFVWGNIGSVTGAIDVEKWRTSGFMNLESWSGEDWRLYGNKVPSQSAPSRDWDDWCSDHWAEEEIRRYWNYFHPYFNNDKNIEWLNCPVFTFDANDYNACVSAFRHFKY